MNKVQATLACHHTLRVAIGTEVGEDKYCRFCGYQPIVKTYPKEWHVWCEDCRYGRWVGQSQPQAGRIVYSHRRNRPSHTMRTEYDTVTADGKGIFRKIPANKPPVALDRGTGQEQDRSQQKGTAEWLAEPPPF